jgi:hypothetical protein
MSVKTMVFLALLALPLSVRADAPPPPDAGCALKAMGAEIQAADVMVSKKPDHVHVLIDLFPYHDAFKAAGPADLKKLALSAAKGCAATKYPEAVSVKVDLAEFSERDSYGAPVWSSIKVLGKFEFTKKKGAWKPVQPKG